jgi:hypothetical protein
VSSTAPLWIKTAYQASNPVCAALLCSGDGLDVFFAMVGWSPSSPNESFAES